MPCNTNSPIPGIRDPGGSSNTFLTGNATLGHLQKKTSDAQCPRVSSAGNL